VQLKRNVELARAKFADAVSERAALELQVSSTTDKVCCPARGRLARAPP
jgi:hypothetical protein